MKGSVIVDHLADNAIEDYKPLNFNFPDEDMLVVEKENELNQWRIIFDGAVHIHENGAGVVIISLKRKQYPILIKLQFKCTNNMVENEVCILKLEVALELNIKKLDVYRDSMPIIC